MRLSLVCVTNDGKIVSGSLDNTIRVWDVGLLAKIATYGSKIGARTVGIIKQYFSIGRERQRAVERN